MKESLFKGWKLTLLVLSILIVTVFTAACGNSTSENNAANNTASGSKEPPKQITVFAAASLTESYTEIGKQIEKDKNIKVTFNFAGSQQLVASINQGVNADVFASADTKNMKTLTDAKKVDKDVIFAKNQLVIAKNKSSNASINSLADLGKDGVKLVVGDKSLPAGNYFYKALDAAKADNAIDQATYDKIIKNIKSQELNVKDVVSKVKLGDADAGVVYKTDANNQKELQVITDKEFSKLQVDYPIAVVSDSKNKTAAQEFIDYVTTGKGKDILKQYGFSVK
ncbi:molybdate ABC transporter substrate-binding protein [Clostridium pasteurianum]|uniref:Molybdenum ABC transporter, periplasmic molybdate-binding protein n=1 Tax=Clostridium pasteurianum BC1 TaxID=86416 RepID=R4KCI6_CLOPA|nr:molybdate ABC transporter substrate-binding protein [Clostridium pasteurianum]AGK98249.1 molybdenum ABC transporter, periplasmic molybdate-binding protein [Clostridium pasteurianum BC1]